MKKCPNCYYENSDIAKYCANCYINMERAYENYELEDNKQKPLSKTGCLTIFVGFPVSFFGYMLLNPGFDDWPMTHSTWAFVASAILGVLLALIVGLFSDKVSRTQHAITRNTAIFIVISSLLGGVSSRIFCVVIEVNAY